MSILNPDICSAKNMNMGRNGEGNPHVSRKGSPSEVSVLVTAGASLGALMCTELKKNLKNFNKKIWLPWESCIGM
jgi:hypothetical protein